MGKYWNSAIFANECNCLRSADSFARDVCNLILAEIIDIEIKDGGGASLAFDVGLEPLVV